jgi:hypothetical protein
MAMA